jgi:NADH-quinone oxidoreductase subunit F
MSAPTDQALFERWRDAPAPLLPLLHAFQARDGYLSDDALCAIARALRVPLADLYGTVSFYHHLRRRPAETATPRVCTGPICALHGAEALCAALNATPMPCAGRCDQPIPVLQQDQLWIATADGARALLPSPLPPPNPVDSQECVFAHLRRPSRATLDGYRRSGGYQGLARALEMTPAQVIEHIREAKLAGRGGAGFPTGLKWQAVADAPGAPKIVVCNADEGEPGCFKDRVLLDHDPHAVIEGMVIAAYATGARLGLLYLRYEYPETTFTLAQALDDARATHYLGSNILGSDFSFEIHLRRGAGAYICGEETALLNSLEGKHPFPRNRPPYPVTHGFNNLPTVVNNVETLAAVAPIMRHAPGWYQTLGRGGHAGTKIISLSGDIARPGNYEAPLGLPLAELLYDWAGGPLPGHTIQAVTMAGLSGGFLAGNDLNVTLDEPSLRAKGTFLGAGGIMVFDERRDMVQIAAQAMRFFAHESCGKCFPCRIGTQRLMERLDGGGPDAPDLWLAEVQDAGRTMQALSACGLGTAAPNITASLLRYFPDQVANHLAARHGEASWTV